MALSVPGVMLNNPLRSWDTAAAEMSTAPASPAARQRGDRHAAAAERRYGGEHQGRLGAELLQQDRDRQRAERRAAEIGEVESCRLLAVQVKDHRERHACQQERQQRREKVERQPLEPNGNCTINQRQHGIAAA